MPLRQKRQLGTSPVRFEADTGTWYDFAIARIGSEHSSVGLARTAANVGYWVRTGQTGRGIATAAVRLVARFAFEELGLLRLESSTSRWTTRPVDAWRRRSSRPSKESYHPGCMVTLNCRIARIASR